MAAKSFIVQAPGEYACKRQTRQLIDRRHYYNDKNMSFCPKWQMETNPLLQEQHLSGLPTVLPPPVQNKTASLPGLSRRQCRCVPTCRGRTWPPAAGPASPGFRKERSPKLKITIRQQHLHWPSFLGQVVPQVRLVLVMLRQAKQGQVRLGQARLDKVKLGQVRSG